MATWTKIAVGVGATAGLAALVVCLMQDDEPLGQGPSEASDATHTTGVGTALQSTQPAGGQVGENASKEQVLELLDRIFVSQESMKSHTRIITAQIKEKPVPFEEAYQLVTGMVAEDPLEKAGLSMEALDGLLQKYSSDPKVQQAIMKMMGADRVASQTSAPPTVKKIIEAHEIMVAELSKVTDVFKKLSQTKRQAYDMKTVMVTATVIVGARVELKTGLASEDIEGAVMMRQAELQSNQDWARLNMAMQTAMMGLVQG